MALGFVSADGFITSKGRRLLTRYTGKGIDPVFDEGRFGIEAPAPRPRNAETRQ